MSDDGRWLAFKATGKGSTPESCLLLRFNRETTSLEVVARDAPKVPCVAFRTRLPGHDARRPVRRLWGRSSANASRNVFRWDGDGLTEPVSVNLSECFSMNGHSEAPALSSDGRYVAFLSARHGPSDQPSL